MQLIKFGPIANELVLVSDGDLYLIPSVSEVDKFIRITSSADKNILNGIANWLYEGIEHHTFPIEIFLVYLITFMVFNYFEKCIYELKEKGRNFKIMPLKKRYI